MTKPIPTVGQEVFCVVSDRYRHNAPITEKTGIVTKVGRKYFTVSIDPKYPHTDKQFSLSTWEENQSSSPKSVCYLSRAEWEDEIEAERLCRVISDAFKYSCNPGCTLEELRAIVAKIPVKT